MSEVSTSDAKEQLLAVLREGLEGPPEPWSYFTDGGADAGLQGTLAKLDAREASRPLGGTSIAAHTHHVIFGMGASAAWIRGDRAPRDWNESWSVSEVDDAAWAGMQERLRSSYAELRQAMEACALSDVMALGGAIGAVAHLAYHLGAVRQKAAFGRLDDSGVRR